MKPFSHNFDSKLTLTSIQENLGLLLFRLNLQQHHNAKYKRKKQPKLGAQGTGSSEPGNIDDASQPFTTTTTTTTTLKEPLAVHFTYRLIISRKHPEKNKEWRPQGGFRDITLMRLMREIPLDLDTDFSGFRFSLWGPAIRVSHRVLNGQDAEFAAMKRKFEASIVSCMVNARSRTTIDFELDVQPITSEVQAPYTTAVHGLAAPQW